jgi:8-oxo-dGTP pyrophosphatase MutT (NUDIX family)
MLKNFYVGVKGIIRVGDKVLLLKKKDQSGAYFWDIPGGRIDDGEDIKTTLQRELKEEVPTLGDFIQGEILGAYRLPQDLKDGLGLLLVFYKVTAEPFTVSYSDEHEGCMWVGTSDLNEIRNGAEAYISPGYLDAVIEALK